MNRFIDFHNENILPSKNLHKHKCKSYNFNIIQSGNVFEIYNYDKAIYYDFEQYLDNSEKKDKDDWEGKSNFSLTRSRRQIRRIVWCNLGRYSKFLTLTYADNMSDVEVFYKDWQRFCSNMRNKGYRLKYLYVLEYQERGAVHAHVLLFNDVYIPIQLIESSWKKGFVKINRIRDIKNLGAYVCKYLTKDTLAKYNSKSYHCSRGLKRPVEKKISLEDVVVVQDLLHGLEINFNVEYDIVVKDIIQNTVHYCQGVLKDE